MKKYLSFLASLLIATIGCAQPTPAGGPPAATQAEVDAGVVRNKYVSPYTLNNWPGGGGAGTVTSVSFTGGLISVGDPTAAAAMTVAGTSGGIVYFSSASTWASSAALAANSLVIGGGAGVAPSTTTTGAGILTFLGTPSFANLNTALTGDDVAGLAANNAFTGVNTFAGSFIRTPATITISEGSPDTGTIDITKGYSQAAIDEATTLTPSAAGTSGQFLTLDATNSTSAPVLVTVDTGTDFSYLAPPGTSTVLLRSTGSTWLLVGGNPAKIEVIATFVVDGGGSAISTTTVAGTKTIDAAYVLYGYAINATAATGTNTVKIWAKAYSTAIPTIANVINTSGVSLSSGTAVYSTTITDFTDTTFAAQDQFRCAVTAVDGAATDLTVTLYGIRL